MVANVIYIEIYFLKTLSHFENGCDVIVYFVSDTAGVCALFSVRVKISA